MTRQPKRNSLFRLRQCEPLESRDLLSGHAFAGEFSRFAAAASLPSEQNFAAQVHVQSEMATVLARQDLFASLGSPTSNSRTVLTATLSDAATGATGTVSYKTYVKDGVTETEFSVSVKGAAADSTLDVSIGDVVVGQITTDADGNGTLKLSSDPDSDETALPDNFPTDIAAGAAVSAGSLTGTLATPTGHGGCGGGEFDGTRLVASLSDSESGSTARVAFKTVTRDGTTTTKFVASVKGATANSSLDVTVDGVVVGQITTDDNGAGKLVLSSDPTGDQLPLPDNFPTTIVDGTTVSVGSMSGTLATAQQEHFGFARFGRRR